MVITLMPKAEPITLEKPIAYVPAHVQELLVFCPKCKALETLSFSNGYLMPTRKFSQKNSHVYHHCGSQKPCRLYKIVDNPKRPVRK